MTHRYSTPLKVILPVLLFSTVWVWSFRNIFDSDVWWHLASGRWMWEHHQILRTDPFSYTVFGHSWINHEWLFEIVMYGVYQLGKIPGLLVAKGILLGVSALGVYASLPKKFEPGLKTLIVIALFYGIRFRNMARADAVSLCLLPWYMSVYFKWAQEAAGAYSWSHWKKDIAWLTVGIILWVNAHGGFVMALGVTGIGALAWFLQTEGRRRLFENPFAGVLVLYSAATLINPYGWRLVTSTFQWTHLLVSGDGAFFTEWLRTPYKGFELFWIFFAVSIALSLMDLARTRQVNLFSWGWLAYAGWVAHVFIRNIPSACFILVPLAAHPLAAWARFSIKPMNRPGFNLGTAMLCGVLCILGFQQMRWGVEASRYPVGGAEFVATHLPPAPGFNDYNFGGYLIWRFYGEHRPVYLDGRLYVIEGYRDVWRSTLDATGPTPAALGQWMQLMQRWQWTWGLVRLRPFRIFFKGQPVSLLAFYFPSRDWALVYRDSLSVVYVRRIPAMQDTIRRYEMPGVYPDVDRPHPLLTLHWEDLFQGGLSGYTFSDIR